ncbi:MAG: reverse transcriptase/maturase family protein [Patescibacteria group bacterium]
MSLENLFAAWEEFLCGKRKKLDVLKFKDNLLENITLLHDDLITHRYVHGAYYHFIVTDPKRRDIHKALVRDRLLHHAIHRKLYPLFEKIFIADSFSCRIGKGTHRAMNRFRVFHRKVSRNDTRTCWVLKLDVRKFFASIDHNVLLSLLHSRILDLELMWLFEQIISSFPTSKFPSGLPLGNLTSRLFANVYLHELDTFVKYQLKAEYYVRYADDFVLLSSSRDALILLLERIQIFLQDQLCLSLHPRKIELCTTGSGIDFLGWVHFPKHRILRTVTKHRAFTQLRNCSEDSVFQSYRGMMQHGNAFDVQQDLINEYWMLSEK